MDLFEHFLIFKVGPVEISAEIKSLALFKDFMSFGLWFFLIR